MTNPAKAKGTSFETAIVNYLREYGIECHRVVQNGWRDLGDIHAGDWVLEAKNHKSIDLASFVDQAEREAGNADKPWFVAVVKRRGKNVSESYVVMPLREWVAIRSKEDSDEVSGSN